MCDIRWAILSPPKPRPPERVSCGAVGLDCHSPQVAVLHRCVRKATCWRAPSYRPKENVHASPVSASCRSHTQRNTVRRASSYETTSFHDFAFENGGADPG